jgi:phosphohistidine phosphatase
MFLTLVRHAAAIAPPSGGDADRTLSLAGRADIRTTGEALAWRRIEPSYVWTSPLVRAVQTAELLAQALQYEGPVEVQRALVPDGSAGELFAQLAALEANADVLLVSHEPFTSDLSAVLLGLAVSGFATAAAFRFDLERPEPGHGQLLWRWIGGHFIE